MSGQSLIARLPLQALVLLYEHFQDKYKDGNSRFAPYIRTLRLYEMGSKVMKELQGTYAAEFKRQWEDQGEESYRWLTQKVLALYPKVFMRNPNRYQAGTYSREDWRCVPSPPIPYYYPYYYDY